MKNFPKKIKTLVAGNGYWGNIVKKSLLKNNLYEVDDIANRKNFHEMISGNYYDLLWIATPNNTHNNLIIESYKKVNYIVCEKPLFTNINEYNILIENKIQNVFTNFVYNYDERVINLKNKLKNKKVNLVKIIMKQKGKKHDVVSNILLSHCLAISKFLFNEKINYFRVLKLTENFIDVVVKICDTTLNITCDNDSFEKIRCIEVQQPEKFVINFTNNLSDPNQPLDKFLNKLPSFIYSNFSNINESIEINKILLEINNKY